MGTFASTVRPVLGVLTGAFSSTTVILEIVILVVVVVLLVMILVLYRRRNAPPKPREAAAPATPNYYGDLATVPGPQAAPGGYGGQPDPFAGFGAVQAPPQQPMPMQAPAQAPVAAPVPMIVALLLTVPAPPLT